MLRNNALPPNNDIVTQLSSILNNNSSKPERSITFSAIDMDNQRRLKEKSTNKLPIEKDLDAQKVSRILHCHRDLTETFLGPSA